MNLIVASAAKAYFQESMKTAVERRKVEVSSEAKDYVVSFLIRYVRSEPFFSSLLPRNKEIIPLVERLRKSKADDRAVLELKLKDIGDSSLFLVGFFYGAEDGRKKVIEYYSQVGEQAYRSCGHSLQQKIDDSAHTFFELADKFSDLGLVLGDLRLAEINSFGKLLHLYEKWVTTRDRRYEALLEASNFLPGKKGSN